MMSSIAAKIGAIALAPFMAVGANAQVGTDVSSRVQPHEIPEAVCTEIAHNLYFGVSDRQVGGEVTELQTYLRAEGYLKQRATGFYGMGTYRAVREFQSDEGLRVTGVVNAETRAEIKAESCGTTTKELDINGITAPAALEVGEEGTWTVDVTSAGDGNLSYAVKWGDEGTMRMSALASEEVQSSATFTHVYSEEGTYTPTFTVTDANGTSVTKAAATVVVSDEADTKIAISSLSATSGYEGESVTITGTGFSSDSSVYVGGVKITEVTVTNDTSITFTLPAMSAGSYDVYVENENGTSNTIRFEVKEHADVRISISSMNAPVRLTVGQDGTWTVNADTNATGNLTYSVKWGDEGMMLSLFRDETTVQTSSTFTHSYATAGTYKPTFTVSDSEGHSSTVSATVVVTK